MPDALTPHERAAIDAFPKSKVKRIQARTSGLTIEQVANGLHWRERGEISKRLHERAKRFMALKAREAQAKAEVKVEPAPALVMVTPPKVDPKPKPKAKPKKPKAKAKRKAPVHTAMRAAVKKRQGKVRLMILAGKTRPEVARALGVGATTIGNDIEALRAAGQLPPANLRRQGRWKR